MQPYTPGSPYRGQQQPQQQADQAYQAQQAYGGQQQQPYAPQQQPYAPQQAPGYGMPSQAAPQQQFSPPYQPQQQPQQSHAIFGFTPDGAAGTAQPQQQAGAGFMSGLTSPLGLMAAGNLLSTPQQYMQQKVGWLRTSITSGTMNALFNIDSTYVASKLFMLFTPFLKRWGYSRQLEQISGGHKFKPPRLDVAAPDLYLPLMAAWTYVLLVCVVGAMKGNFTPDQFSSRVYGACISWGIHWAVGQLLLKGMSASGLPWSELLAYTGYAFIPVCASIAVGAVGGRLAYYVVWGYGSLVMAIFLVKCMKRVVLQDSRQHGMDLKTTNYLLLGLAAFQFPYAWWLGPRL